MTKYELVRTMLCYSVLINIVLVILVIIFHQGKESWREIAIKIALREKYLGFKRKGD